MLETQRLQTGEISTSQSFVIRTRYTLVSSNPFLPPLEFGGALVRLRVMHKHKHHLGIHIGTLFGSGSRCLSRGSGRSLACERAGDFNALCGFGLANAWYDYGLGTDSVPGTNRVVVFRRRVRLTTLGSRQNALPIGRYRESQLAGHLYGSLVFS